MPRRREFSVLELDHQYRAALLEAIAARLVHADDLKNHLSAADVLNVGRELLGHEHAAVVPLAAVMPVPQFLVWHHTTGFNRRVIPIPRDGLTVVVPEQGGRGEIEVRIDSGEIVIEASGVRLAAFEFAELVPPRDTN